MLNKSTNTMIPSDLAEKVKNPGPKDLALICPLEGGSP